MLLLRRWLYKAGLQLRLQSSVFVLWCRARAGIRSRLSTDTPDGSGRNATFKVGRSIAQRVACLSRSVYYFVSPADYLYPEHVYHRTDVSGYVCCRTGISVNGIFRAAELFRVKYSTGRRGGCQSRRPEFGFVCYCFETWAISFNLTCVRVRGSNRAHTAGKM